MEVYNQTEDDMSEGERYIHAIMMVLIYGGSAALVIALIFLLAEVL